MSESELKPFKYAPTPWKTADQDWRTIEDAAGSVVADVRVTGPEGGAALSRLISKAWLIPELVEALVGARDHIHASTCTCTEGYECSRCEMDDELDEALRRYVEAGA